MQVKLNTMPAPLADFQALPRSTPEEVCAGFLCRMWRRAICACFCRRRARTRRAR